jgi:hypothetical protein
VADEIGSAIRSRISVPSGIMTRRDWAVAGRAESRIAIENRSFVTGHLRERGKWERNSMLPLYHNYILKSIPLFVALKLA